MRIPRIIEGAKLILGRMEFFSRYVLDMPLYPYQEAPMEALVQSVLNQQGREFLLVFPRQSGKNEATAHLLVYLLNVLQRVGGNIVYAAIGDALGRGMTRLDERLDNRWNRGRWRAGLSPRKRCLGNACVVFLSSHPQAHSRGETARWLLVVDELQDQDPHHIEAVFTPMRAANHATALYLGTVRTRQDALWRKKEMLHALEAEDGIKRVFMATPEEVSAANPAFGHFLAGQVALHGRQHPTIRAEYFLEPLDGEGGLFPSRRQKLMRGPHPRQRAPMPQGRYVATVDVAGQDEAATDPLASLTYPGRDYTVATIFELLLPEAPNQAPSQAPIQAPTQAPDQPPAKTLPNTPDQAHGPFYQAVDVFVDQGSRHFEETPGRPRLADQLVAFLELWRVGLVVIDATGVGEGLAGWLAAALGAGRVAPFKFTGPSKAALGSRFITLIETGRFGYWQGDENTPLSDGWWFWQQVRHCSYNIAPGHTLDTGLRWSVPAGATISTPTGRQPVHDDRLISAALVAELDRLLLAKGGWAGDARSDVIQPADPLQHLNF